MNAFSASIFTEQTQASLKEDAYNLTISGNNNASSILEFDDAILLMETEEMRSKYISLLESQKENLGLINESVLGTALLAGIIAAVIGFIGSLIGLLTGKQKTVSFHIPSFDKKRDAKGSDEKFSYNDFKVDQYGGANKLPCKNPYINRSMKVNDAFETSAANKTVEIDLYTYPNMDVVCGNFDSLDDAIEICRRTEEIFTSMIKRNDFTNVNETIDQLDDKLDTVRANIDKLNATGQTEHTTMNAKAYLNKSYNWLVGYSGESGWRFNDTDANPNIAKLSMFMTKLHQILLSFNPNDKGYDDYQAKVWNKAVGFERRVVNMSLAMSKKMLSAYNNYWGTVRKEIIQMNRICDSLRNTGTVDESAIFENAYYQESAELQEYMFGRDTTDDILFAEDFCQMIDDTSARFSIYMHQNQMRVMNEEALIFSETGISDYEKYQRLQAVNEALANKIKRGWYNTINALKEIFRKFMEKLTANFNTTKAYLDRYKNIILRANFNPNDQYKTQDLATGIKRIINTQAPALNFTDMVNKDCDSAGKFFNNVFLQKANIDRTDSEVPQINDDSSAADISNYFKIYFCMEGHDTTLTGPQFQRDIKYYYDFLYDIKKINNLIKKSLKDIEDTATKVMKQAGLDVNKVPAEGQAQPAPAAAQPQVGNDSAIIYSNLYQKWFTLNEDGILVEAEITNQQQQQGGNQQQQVDPNAPNAKNLKNVADKGDADDTKDIRNTERNSVDAKVKAYTDVCSSMLKAKMSACEFIRNECMQIIRHHVQAHIGNKPANPQPQQ